MLDFLGYYENYGWNNAKHIKFGSSVRFELLKNKNQDDDFKIKVIFDDEEIKLGFNGNQSTCDFEKFFKYFEENLLLDDLENVRIYDNIKI